MLKLRKKKKPRPLKFGSIVHDMLEAHTNGEDAFAVLDRINNTEQKLFNAEREMYGEIVEDIRCIMTEYFDYYKNDGITYARRNGKRAEHEFEVGISKDITVTGKIDSFAKTANGLRWLTEHKSFNHLPNEDERWRNVQSAIYIRINDIMGWPELDGTMWDYLSSKPPGRPQMLKNGTLSQRRINTLPSRIREVLKENQLKASNYQKMIAAAESNRAQYFQRMFNPTKTITVERVWTDFIDTSTQMVEYGHNHKDMNIDRHCSYCDYQERCRAELTGGDVDYITERDYEKSKPHKKG